MEENGARRQFENIKDVLDAITKIKKIQVLLDNSNRPNRKDMIETLQDTKTTAPAQITAREFSQGDVHWMPFSRFTDADLYRKLPQYQQGLEDFCIEKIGKGFFDDLMGRNK